MRYPLSSKLGLIVVKPYVQELIDRTIACILDVMRKSRLDKSIRAVILAGALSRGEGTILTKKNGIRILSDIDLVFVVRRPWDFFSVGPRMSALLSDLNFPLKVSVGAMWRMNTHRNVYLYELKCNGKVLFGDARVLDAIPTFTPKEIPRWEGIRLLLDSLIGLVGVFTHDSPLQTPSDAEDFYYACVKGYLACCDALLLFDGRYASTYRERFQELLEMRPDQMPDRMPGLKEKMVEAMRFKLGIDTGWETGRITTQSWFDCRDAIIKVLSYTLSMYQGSTGGKLETLLDGLKKRVRSKHLGLVDFVNDILTEKRLRFSLLTCTPPKLHVQIAAVYLADALTKNMKVDPIMMQRAARHLGSFQHSDRTEIDPKDSFQTWSRMAGVLCEAAKRTTDVYLKQDTGLPRSEIHGELL